MTETRRLKIKIGDAEFEADVPESNVQPMYDRFLSILEGQRASLFRRITTTNSVSSDKSLMTEKFGRATSVGIRREIFDRNDPLFTRVFQLNSDNSVTLKLLPLPNGNAHHADALLLLLYGYHQLKNEGPVSACELNRAAEQSGISLRCLSNGYARNHRYMVRAGYGKGTSYRLNSEGMAIAKEIMAAIIEHTESASLRISDKAGPSEEKCIEELSPVERRLAISLADHGGRLGPADSEAAIDGQGSIERIDINGTNYCAVSGFKRSVKMG